MPAFLRPSFALAIAVCAQAHAQTPPDAGRVLQEFTVPPAPLAPSTDLQIQTEAGRDQTPPGGKQVEIGAIRFSGMSRFDEATLREAVRDGIGRSHDIAGLHDLARRVTRFYRAHGYPFARAYLPPQRVVDGELHIAVIEGRYGAVSATGDAELAARAQPFLDVLQPGELIESAPLERATLILADLPGVVLEPVIKPGETVGTGDFEARVGRGPAFEGRLGLDNHGNRYTGQYRALASANWNSHFLFGDQLSASAVVSEEKLWIGQLAYSLPLGVSGLRAQAAYTHTRYELGKEFASLDATGFARIAALGVSYPLVRARQHNLVLSAQVQHKELRDEYGAVNTTNDKSSQSLPVSLRFDVRDSLAGGGVTYGALTWTPGRLSLDSRDLREQDELSARTAGGFQKLGLDIARLQWLQGGLSLFGRFSGQLADKNLDSSERFSLGGAGGVRAYPQGEAVGDKGWLAQLELRYAVGPATPYLFYDAGKITRNVSPWIEGANHRSIAGVGAGVRWTHDRFGIDAVLAWSTDGGAPESDRQERRPRFWLKLEYAL